MRTLLLLGCALLTSCANVTTTKIHRTATGDVTIDSGKDVKIGALALDDGPVHLLVKDYSSAANVDAVNAQANREIGMVHAVTDAVLKALQAGAGLAAKGVGVP